MSISTHIPAQRDASTKLSTSARRAEFTATARDRLQRLSGGFDCCAPTSDTCRESVDIESGKPEPVAGQPVSQARRRPGARLLELATSRIHFDQRTRGMLAVLMLVVAVSAAVVAWFAWPSPQPVSAAVPVADSQDTTEETAAKLAVSVVGDVAEPGLVEVPAGSRVADAVEAAGGLKNEGGAGYLNLARKINDGELIVVESQDSDADDSDDKSSDDDAEPTDDDASGDGGDTDSASSSGPVNVNEATAEELTTVPGIGPVTAENIVEYREQNGGFDSTDQLTEVSGIGPATLDKISDLVTV